MSQTSTQPSHVCSETTEADPTCEPPWMWAWILVGFAAGLGIVLLLSENVVSFISQVLGARAVQFGLRVRSSALFNWILLVLDFAIGLFFALLLLVTAGLLFDGFHEAWGAPGFLARLGQAHVVGTTISLATVWMTIVWVAAAGRVVFLASLFWQAGQHAQRQQQPQQQSPTDAQADARAHFFPGHPPVDYGLLLLVGMTLLSVFPWSTQFLESDSNDSARMQFLLVFIVWAFLLYVTVQLRIRLHRQVASIPVVTWRRLHHQAPCDGAGGVTHVDVGNLRMAGLVSASAPHSQPIFLRQEAIDQFVWLHEFVAGNHEVDTDGGREVARVAHIEGPPGTGKSTITWAWACELARQQPVVWAHHSSDLHQASTVTLLAGGRVASFEQHGDIHSAVLALMRWASARVLVVDGVKRETAQLAARAREWATADPLRRKVITVSSAQLAIDGITEGKDAITFREVFSWANADYTAACQAPGGDRFWQHVKGNLGWQPPANGQHRTPQEEQHYKATLLDERFFLAGASARWMFAFTTAKLRREIDVVVHRVQNAGAAVGQQEGMRAHDAVNKAYARFQSAFAHGPSVYCLVSGRVTRLLGDRCDLNFITTATRHNLPAGTDGTVFELDFRHHIKQAAQHGHGNNFVTVYVHDGQQCRGLRLPVTRVFEFDAVADLPALDIVDGAWFLPLDDCNGGYDFAFYYNGCLFSLQITKELPSHSEKWRYMNELAEVVHNRLTSLAQPGLQFVEHIYVVPVPNVDGFQAPSGGRVEGNPYWLDTHRRIVSFQRAGGAGPVNVVGTADIESASREAPGRNGGLVPLQFVRGRQMTRAASARSVGNVPW